MHGTGLLARILSLFCIFVRQVASATYIFAIFIKTQDSTVSNIPPKEAGRLRQKTPRILIIGLGQIGYHNAEYMNRLGLYVEGFDLSRKAVQRALNAGIIRKEARDFSGYDYHLICVSTHNPANISEPSFESLIKTAEHLEQEAKEGGLVSIESTVTRGISRQVENILRHKLHVAHVPHRFFLQDKQEHGVKQLRVLGGCRDCCTQEALNFYAAILNIPIFTVKSIEVAELSKIVENSHRFLEIAFEEELKIFCDNEGLDFAELQAAINSKWNIKILEARDGIGGHCLPKDTKLFFGLEKNLLPTSIVHAAIESDRLYRCNLTKEEDLQFFVAAPLALKRMYVKER